MLSLKLALPLIGGGQVRGMATLKDLKLRLKSVKNIQKITKSMKMVSAAKFARAEKDLRSARSYGAGATSFYEKAEIKAPEGKGQKQLIVTLSSDRGLCGGVHSQLCKQVKLDVAAKPSGVETRVVCVGDKSRAILQRVMKDKFLVTCSDIGKMPPTFMDASKVAQSILASEFSYDLGDIYYNKFKSVISYKASKLPLFSLDTVAASKNIYVFDSLDAETLRCYQEFQFASLIFYGMKENITSEQSSRMSAMDNASKNAGEMINKLTLKFNRTRQAVITRELIEIISGASALD